jgi:hypothetical protein
VLLSSLVAGSHTIGSDIGYRRHASKGLGKTGVLDRRLAHGSGGAYSVPMKFVRILQRFSVSVYGLHERFTEFNYFERLFLFKLSSVTSSIL